VIELNGVMSDRENPTRAEMIRKRRAKRSGRRTTTKNNTRGNKQDSPGMPPVLIRGKGSNVAGKGRRQRNPRRRFDIPLSTSTPGTEIRLPSLPSVRLGWRVISSLVVAAFSALLYYLWTSPTYQVKTVEVQGNERLKSGELNSVVDLVGDPIFMADPEVIKQDVRTSFPELQEVSVHVDLPSKVIMAVKEREPVLAWHNGDTVIWVDAGGFAFPPRGQPPDLVRVESQVALPLPSEERSDEVPTAPSEVAIPSEMLSAIITLSSQAPNGAPLVYDSQLGLGWQTAQGWDVYFGLNVLDIEMKLKVYQAVVSRLKESGIKPSLISVEFQHAPYYRLEP